MWVMDSRNGEGSKRPALVKKTLFLVFPAVAGALRRSGEGRINPDDPDKKQFLCYKVLDSEQKKIHDRDYS